MSPAGGCLPVVAVATTWLLTGVLLALALTVARVDGRAADACALGLCTAAEAFIAATCSALIVRCLGPRDGGAA